MREKSAYAPLVVKLCCVLTLFCAAVPAFAGAAPTEDWPQFRGSRHDGVSLGNGVLDRDRFGLDVAWERDLGSGYSSISVADGRGVTMFADEGHDVLAAFDVATGEELWRYRIAETYEGHDGSSDGPISTPTIDGGVVYGLGPHGQLFAVRLADGEELWSRTLDGETDSRAPHYGFATVPVTVGDLVVVQTGGPEGHSVTAFDRATGEPRWSTEDDPVNYQSPAVIELGGRRQLVAINDKYLLGIEPASGDVLWKHEHGTSTFEAFAQPVALGGDRILVSSLNEAVALQLSGDGTSFEVEELWRSNAFQRSYAIPVLHEGHLYGFNSRFLTCVDAATGEVVWKSRPPGGQGLILVDGQLLILSPQGDLVVAEASPEGYAERARLPVFASAGMTAPSYAGGRLYVRNLERMAAIEVTEAPTAAMAEAPEPERELLGAFGDFVRRAEAAEDTAALVEDYLGSQTSFPIVEEDGLVHFVYRGEVADIALAGNFLEFNGEEVMHPIAGTDVYFKSLEVDPEAVWEYRFNVDFGNLVTDPENPHTIGSPFGPTSVLHMPGFEVPDHVAEPEGPRGRLDSFQFHSDVRDGARRIRLYVPPGYDGSDERYPLVVYNLGGWALDMAELDRSLDNLIGGGRIEPLIVAFVPRRRGEYEGPESAAYVRMLTDELVPHVDKHYRTLAEPASRTILGPVGGGAAAIYAALKAPDVFGNAAAQSMILSPALAEELLPLIEDGVKRPITAYVEQRRHDLLIEGALDAAGDSRRVYEALAANGYDVRSREVPGAWGWSSWRAELDDVLESFYPAAEPEE